SAVSGIIDELEGIAARGREVVLEGDLQRPGQRRVERESLLPEISGSVDAGQGEFRHTKLRGSAGAGNGQRAGLDIDRPAVVELNVRIESHDAAGLAGFNESAGVIENRQRQRRALPRRIINGCGLAVPSAAVVEATASIGPNIASS